MIIDELLAAREDDDTAPRSVMYSLMVRRVRSCIYMLTFKTAAHKMNAN
jgi:hypothetical protein